MAVRLDNKNASTYRKLGWMQIKNDILEKGVDNLQKAHSLDPKNNKAMQ